MPELAEVEYYRKRWDLGIGHPVERVLLHPQVRDFRDCCVTDLSTRLKGQALRASLAHGKRLAFRFSGGCWLGLHLGMTGKLATVTPFTAQGKYEHLVLVQKPHALVFSDVRQFGCIRFYSGPGVPSWWRDLPASLLSSAFTRGGLQGFLQRHGRSPLKAVLLHQDGFPGVGNWMADEILWRARIRPTCPAGRVRGRKLSDLFTAVKEVGSDAMAVIAVDWKDPPDSWLFNHRWKDGGRCPRTGRPLIRQRIRGRTTCWSPAWQRWPRTGISPIEPKSPAH